MRKILPSLFLITAIAALPTLALGATINPSTAAESCPFTYTLDDGGAAHGAAIWNITSGGGNTAYANLWVYNAGGTLTVCGDDFKLWTPPSTFGAYLSSLPIGNYSLMEIETPFDIPQNFTYDQAKAKAAFFNEVLFSVTSAAPPPAVAAPLFTLPTSAATNLTANVSDTLADSGTLALVVAAIGFPLLFWVMHRIKKTMPGSRKEEHRADKFPSSEELSRQNERFYVAQKFGGYKNKKL